MALSEAKIKEQLEFFSSMTSIRDVAQLLNIKYSNLIYFTRIIPLEKKYIEFKIKKKGGGERVINAPNSGLKSIQKRLNWILQHFITPKVCAHGFLYEKSIKTNAKIHSNRSLVLNIDLENFFPSINFGRVRGLFKSPPFNFNNGVATILAQICCNGNHLPQGAPTSPVVSNFICAKLDGELLQFCKKYKCFYTRYADDMSFSMNSDSFSDELVKVKKDGSVIVGKGLNSIIKGNGFTINKAKVRLQGRKERQVVTGLVVNKFPNVKREFIKETRAMLHAWYKYGLEEAQNEFYKRFNTKQRKPDSGLPKYENVLTGRVEFIGMIKGQDNPVYQKLHRKLDKLFPEHGINSKYDQSALPLVVTEGGSDRMHLKAALRFFQKSRLYHYLDIEISDYRGSMGQDELYALCKQRAATPEGRRTIFIFDSDNLVMVKNVNNTYGRPRYWGNNVYSFSLPIPPHRVSTPNVSIELYYTDDEIKRFDSNGRRLFLNVEFDIKSRRHLNEDLTYNGKKVLPNKGLCALDDDVMNSAGVNIALSKGDFAKNVLEQRKNFDDFDFSEFKLIFNLIESICKHKPVLGEE